MMAGVALLLDVTERSDDLGEELPEAKARQLNIVPRKALEWFKDFGR